MSSATKRVVQEVSRVESYSNFIKMSSATKRVVQEDSRVESNSNSDDEDEFEVNIYSFYSIRTWRFGPEKTPKSFTIGCLVTETVIDRQNTFLLLG